MNEPEDEAKPKEYTTRRKAGRILFMAGLLILSSSVLSILVVSVAAYSGVAVKVSAYFGYLVPIGIFGGLLSVAGLLMFLLPEGPSKNGVWVMMMGPYAGRN